MTTPTCEPERSTDTDTRPRTKQTTHASKARIERNCKQTSQLKPFGGNLAPTQKRNTTIQHVLPVRSINPHCGFKAASDCALAPPAANQKNCLWFSAENPLLRGPQRNREPIAHCYKVKETKSNHTQGNTNLKDRIPGVRRSGSSSIDNSLRRRLWLLFSRPPFDTDLQPLTRTICLRNAMIPHANSDLLLRNS